MNQPMVHSGTATEASAVPERVDAFHYSVVLDPDLQRDNPVEAKHRRLVRSHRNGPLDRDLKPNPKIRDELNVRKRILEKKE
jgi:phosphatidylinositol 3-kinase